MGWPTTLPLGPRLLHLPRAVGDVAVTSVTVVHLIGARCVRADIGRAVPLDGDRAAVADVAGEVCAARVGREAEPAVAIALQIGIGIALRAPAQDWLDDMEIAQPTQRARA